MTREKIREGLVGMELGTEESGVLHYYLSSEDVTKILSKQVKLGAVIKVDRDLPETHTVLELASIKNRLYDQGVVKGFHLGRASVIKAGYEATEPIMGED